MKAGRETLYVVGWTWKTGAAFECKPVKDFYAARRKFDDVSTKNTAVQQVYLRTFVVDTSLTEEKVVNR